MGLTRSSTSKESLKDLFNVKKENDDDFIIAVAGNPNTGKSTVFNALTGLHQHTGNWPGKTVVNMQGKFKHKNNTFIVVDLPGTYSLLASSIEEEVARDFICFGKPDVTVIVIDATCIERNLNLLFQITEITNKVVVCLNLMDEAKRKSIDINIPLLSKKLCIPIVPTTARSHKGISGLKDKIYDVCNNITIPYPVKIKYSDDILDFIKKTAPKLDSIFKGQINSEWLALRLLDGDKSILNSLSKYLKYNLIKNFEKAGDISE